MQPPGTHSNLRALNILFLIINIGVFIFMLIVVKECSEYIEKSKKFQIEKTAWEEQNKQWQETYHHWQ